MRSTAAEPSENLVPSNPVGSMRRVALSMARRMSAWFAYCSFLRYYRLTNSTGDYIVDTEIDRSKKSDALQVIVTGNPIDGFCFHGPFLQSNQEDRDVYVDQFLKGEEWWGAPLVNLANANIEDHV